LKWRNVPFFWSSRRRVSAATREQHSHWDYCRDSPGGAALRRCGPADSPSSGPLHINLGGAPQAFVRSSWNVARSRSGVVGEGRKRSKAARSILENCCARNPAYSRFYARLIDGPGRYAPEFRRRNFQSQDLSVIGYDDIHKGSNSCFRLNDCAQVASGIGAPRL